MPERSNPSAPLRLARWRGLSGLSAVACVVVLLAGCTPAADEKPDPGRIVLKAPAPGVVTIADEDDYSAAFAMSGLLFAEAPVVVVAAEDALPVAIEAAERAGVPVFPLPHTQATDVASPPPSEALETEIDRLGATRVVTVGVTGTIDTGAVEQVDAETDRDAIAAALAPLPAGVTLGDPTSVVVDASALPAAQAIAIAAGATIIEQASPGDILRQPEVIDALSRLQPRTTILLGMAARQPDPDWSVRAARTGYELRGGGQRLIGAHRFVALYGVPDVPVLGVLGEQGVAETIARAESTAAEYDDLSDLPVVPTLEIIATVAAGDAGADGNFSNELDPDLLETYVTAAETAGVYVVIDLQPGRTDFLTQAKEYQSVLEHPNVGLALDPEWRLAPDQFPLEQIGSVGAEDVNAVTGWLAELVDTQSLPPKMVVLHEFRESMLTGRDQIETSRPQLELVVHVDGQGSQSAKQATWQALLALPPHGVGVGWKNFIDEDTPVLSPAETMREVSPRPDLISYQ